MDDARRGRAETESVGLGHDAERHHGSLKPPIYQTSTFVFSTAKEMKRFFEVAYGLEGARAGEEMSFIYSRLDSPNLRVAETRLAAWEGTDDALVFNSGLAAINTMFLTYLRPNDLILYSSPIYGGTSKILETLFSEMGVTARPFASHTSEAEFRAMAAEARLKLILLETPANPTNDLFDISMASRVAHEHGARLAVDNTFLSPVWQNPVDHGADLVIHSATKYLGGHSDITAGVVCGGSGDMEDMRHLRYQLGTTASPMTTWMLTRSLETLQLRVERQTDNATRLAVFLAGHPKVASVKHLSLLKPDDPASSLYGRQCRGPGAMISFEVVGGEDEAFRFLDAMRLINLATSLGGTESLASHPASTSHSTVPEFERKAIGVTPGLIRLSVGIEAVEDLSKDLDQALSRV